MTKLFLSTLTVMLFLTSSDCKKNIDDQSPTNPLQLVVEDANCTEAWIKISLEQSENNRTVALKRDDSTIANIIMYNSDSLFVDEGLLPNKTYTYTLITNSLNVKAQATTMDTTSHEWNYTLDTLGESNSYLTDVAIINDTLAYAVGEIHIGDSLYNAAMWNGKKWQLMRVPSKGSVTYPPLQAIWVISENNILLSWGGGVITFDGKNFTDDMRMNPLLTGAINKIWRTGSNNVYLVGGNGSIVYYNGSSWQKQESGTTQYLVDIKGNNKDLYSVGINMSRDGGVVLKQNNGNWEKIIEGVNESSGFIPEQLFKTQLYGSTNGLWVDNTGTVYTVGNYMYRFKLGRWDYVKSLSENYLGGKLGYRGYLQAVNGNAANDIFISGQRGTLKHFNGNTWIQVGTPFDYNNTLHYWYSIAVKNNLAIAAGSMDRKGRVIVLRRN